MAKENKRSSFVMYLEWGMIFRELPAEKCKQLICDIFNCFEDGTQPDFEDDLLMKISWNQIWNQIERDGIRYEEMRARRAESGRQGGLASGRARSKAKQNEANEANASFVKQNEANEAVNVDVDGNVNNDDSVDDDINDSVDSYDNSCGYVNDQITTTPHNNHYNSNKLPFTTEWAFTEIMKTKNWGEPTAKIILQKFIDLNQDHFSKNWNMNIWASRLQKFLNSENIPHDYKKWEREQQPKPICYTDKEGEYDNELPFS